MVTESRKKYKKDDHITLDFMSIDYKCSPPPHLKAKSKPIVPPYRFACIHGEVFRGSLPTRQHFRFLKRLALKNILCLTPCDIPHELCQFCVDQGIEIYHIEVQKAKEDQISVSYLKIHQALQIIMDSRLLPLYICCLDGIQISGLTIMCLRKLQMWSFKAAFNEYKRFVRSPLPDRTEADFFDHFSVDRVVWPIEPTSWILDTITMASKTNKDDHSTETPLEKSDYSIKKMLATPEQSYDHHIKPYCTKDKINPENMVSLTIKALALERYKV